MLSISTKLNLSGQKSWASSIYSIAACAYQVIDAYLVGIKVSTSSQPLTPPAFVTVSDESWGCEVVNEQLPTVYCQLAYLFT